MADKEQKPNFNEWLESDTGKKSADYSTLTAEKYLLNRLWWAFDAGTTYGIAYGEAQQKARTDELEKENAVLKDRLKRLGDNSPF